MIFIKSNRNWRQILVTAVLLLTLINSASAGLSTVKKIHIDGTERNYALYTPAQTPRFLLTVLHGGHGSGKSVARLTDFYDLAEKHRILIVFPDSAGNHWNDGRSTTNNGQDDVEFLSLLSQRLAHDYGISSNQRFLIGISNGGMMAYRVACESAGSFDAISAVIANLPVAQMTQCDAYPPPDLLIILGTADPLMPWDGGEVRKSRFSGNGGKVNSAENTFEFWKQQYRCTAPIQRTPLPDSNLHDNSHGIRWQAADCREDTRLELIELVNAGHTWPGKQPGWLMRKIVGSANMDLDAREVIIDFFIN